MFFSVFLNPLNLTQWKAIEFKKFANMGSKINLTERRLNEENILDTNEAAIFINCIF